MKRLLLLGGGGHCRACIDVIEATRQFHIAGVVQPLSDGRGHVLGYPVLGSDDDVRQLLKQTPQALVTVGQIKSPKIRIHLFELLKSCNAELPVIASPNAYQSRHAFIGEGSILMHGSVTNANAKVGANCIINSLALIEHDAVIGNHCHIATGARVNGGVRIGEGCFIGSGAILKEGIEIGVHSIIGAGQVITKNVPVGTVLRGVV